TSSPRHSLEQEWSESRFGGFVGPSIPVVWNKIAGAAACAATSRGRWRRAEGLPPRVRLWSDAVGPDPGRTPRRISWARSESSAEGTDVTEREPALAVPLATAVFSGRRADSDCTYAVSEGGLEPVVLACSLVSCSSRLCRSVRVFGPR